MENTDAPGIQDEPGEHWASGRGRDSLDAHFLFADALLGHQISYGADKRKKHSKI